MDRFGEIDHTAELLAKIAKNTTDSVIINREDRRIYNLRNEVPEGVDVSYFGLNQQLRPIFLNDDEIYSNTVVKSFEEAKAPTTWGAIQTFKPPNEVILLEFSDSTAVYSVNQHKFTTSIKIKGVHNVYNTAAAIATVRAIMKNELNGARMFEVLSEVTTAFGRGETIVVNGVPVELVLVKNPAGFRLALLSYEADLPYSMIAINDEYADGRDVSWLWDVDFSILNSKRGRKKGAFIISGHRVYDLALRLKYSNVVVSNIEPDLSLAVKKFVSEAGTKRDLKRIYCTYTAMLKIRKILGKKEELSV
jgi:UDP-N-acetylmuramyl tripeptide synthase